VTATGSAPLAYQWRFNGTDIVGATSPTLTFNKVTPDQSGEYTVRVGNDAGVVVSRPANLVVTTQARQVALGKVAGSAGSAASVPITLAAVGDENRVRFSISFDAQDLAFASATLGSGAGGAALNLNVNQLESGRVGLQVSLPANQVFPPGQRQIAVVHFSVLDRAQGLLDLGFLDAPVAREATTANGTTIPADFIPGSISIAAGPTGPTLSALTVSDVDRVQFTLTGQAGASFRLESSGDLRVWTTVSVVANPTGTVVFTDPALAGSGPKFYRAIQLP
jgi:hypothetical protein